MGGMGRTFDGGYAEYTVVPATQVRAINADVSWKILGALPEMMQTAWGSLFQSLQLKKGERLLIRGGSSSVGLAAAAIAKHHGASLILSTTRSTQRRQLLIDSGAHDVLIDDNGSIAEEARKRYPEGFDKVLELVGVTTLADSFKTVRKGGTVCGAGITGGSWVMEQFTPQAVIPNGCYLTVYGSSVESLFETPLEEMAKLVEDGTMRIPIRTYRMDQIVEAHRAMEESAVGAKMVVMND